MKTLLALAITFSALNLAAQNEEILDLVVVKSTLSNNITPDILLEENFSESDLATSGKMDYNVAVKLSGTSNVAIIKVKLMKVAERRGSSTLLTQSFVLDAAPSSPYSFYRHGNNIILGLGEQTLGIPTECQVQLIYTDESTSEWITMPIN